MRAFAALAMAALLSCAAQARNDDEAARAALAAKRYADVINAYEGRTPADLGAIQRYRLAIALQGLGKPMEAWINLQAARSLDPAGRFASSPARLNALVASIQQACLDASRPRCDPAPEVPKQDLPEVPRSGAETIDTARQVPAPQPVPAAEAVISQAVQPVNTLATPQVNAGSQNVSAESQVVTWATLTVSLLAMLGIGWLIARSIHADRALPGGVRAIHRLRDDTAALLDRLDATAPGQGTELRAVLQSLLPLLEREAGRAQYRAKGFATALVASDRPTADLLARLSAAPLDALSSTSRDVEALFRREVL
jgi:hypothetical protein